eukprot:4109375-Pyramimonas_sp.AAC.1
MAINTLSVSATDKSYTWLANQGNEHRIDYICMDCTWSARVYQHTVLHDMDDLTALSDRLPVVCTILSSSTHKVSSPKPQFDTRGLQDPDK